MFYTKSLHPKCPTTLLWVEALFYLCCVGTGTGQLPPVHTNYSDTSEAWIGNSVSYLNWTQILHKYLHTFSNITQIFTHFLQVLMVYKKVYNVSRKYQENWNKEHPINNQQKSHPFNVSDKYHVCLGSSTIVGHKNTLTPFADSGSFIFKVSSEQKSKTFHFQL